MIEFNTIGVLLRDITQNYPLDYLKSLFEPLGATLHILNRSHPEEKLDLVIAMGGDGTVLHALEIAPDCPVLAINYGTVGFLTAGDRDDLKSLLNRLLEGDYFLSERMLLRGEFNGNVFHAVNEIAIKSSLRMININVFVNEAPIRTIRGDGVIVGTPTGSTGYLLSTGAPVVMPDTDCFILDGINEYNFSSRALILSPNSHIRLHVAALQKGRQALLNVDGKPEGQLPEGGEIVLTRSERRGKLIFFSEDYFFRNLSSRLSWN